MEPSISRFSDGSGSKAKLRKCSNVDRISHLPDSVIFHIVSFLSTKDVVATSILSTRWKFLWTKATTVDFDVEGEVDRKKKNDKGMTFVQFVYRVLLQSEHLHKFRLKWYNGGCNAVDINMWVSYVISQNVGTLDLCIDNSEVCLPSNLFSSGTLEILKLKGPVLVKVPRVVCLKKLKHMNLDCVRYESAKSFQTLIAGCLVLRSLEVVCAEGREIVSKIYSASLRSLKIEYIDPFGYLFHDVAEKVDINTPSLEFLHVEDPSWTESLVKCPTLGEVKLCLGLSACQGHTKPWYLIMKLVRALQHVRIMKLEGQTIKAFSNATMPLSVRFERLIRLDIEFYSQEWSSLKFLLQNSPKLQILNLRRGYEQTAEGDWKDPEDFPECLSCSLEEVSLTRFRGYESEMTMIRYILNHGVVMRRLNLNCIGSAPQEKYRMLQRISTFTRCSRACKIHFD